MKKNVTNFTRMALALLCSFSLVFTSCNYGEDIDALKEQVAALESTISTLEAALKGGATVTDVTPIDGGVKVTLSDGKTFNAMTTATGTPGVVIEIGENGNWFIGGKDTGKPSTGENGKYWMPEQNTETKAWAWVEYDGEGVATGETVAIPEMPSVVWNPTTGELTIGANGDMYSVALTSTLRSLDVLTEYWNSFVGEPATRFYTLFSDPTVADIANGVIFDFPYPMYDAEDDYGFITSNTALLPFRVNPTNADVEGMDWDYLARTVTRAEGDNRDLLHVVGDVMYEDGAVFVPTKLHGHELSNPSLTFTYATDLPLIQYIPGEIIIGILEKLPMFRPLEPANPGDLVIEKLPANEVAMGTKSHLPLDPLDKDTPISFLFKFDQVSLEATAANGDVVVSDEFTVQHLPLYPRVIYNTDETEFNHTHAWDKPYESLVTYYNTEEEAIDLANLPHFVFPFNEGNGTIDLNPFVNTWTAFELEWALTQIETGPGAPFEERAMMIRNGELLEELGFEITYKFTEIDEFMVKDPQSQADTDQQWFIEETSKEGEFELVKKYGTSALDRTPVVRVDAYVSSCEGDEVIIATAYIKLVISDLVSFENFDMTFDPFTVEYTNKEEMPRLEYTVPSMIPDNGLQKTNSEEINIELYNGLGMSNNQFVEVYGSDLMNDFYYITENDGPMSHTQFYFSDAEGNKLDNDEIEEGVYAIYKEIVVDAVNTIEMGIYLDPTKVDFDGVRNNGSNDSTYVVYLTLEPANLGRPVVFKYEYTITHEYKLNFNQPYLVPGEEVPTILITGDPHRQNKRWELYGEMVEHIENYLGRVETNQIPVVNQANFDFVYNYMLDYPTDINNYRFVDTDPTDGISDLTIATRRHADRLWAVDHNIFDAYTNYSEEGTHLEEALVYEQLTNLYNTDITLDSLFHQTQTWPDGPLAADLKHGVGFEIDDDVQFITTFVNDSSYVDHRGNINDYVVRYMNPFYISGKTDTLTLDKAEPTSVNLKPFVVLRATNGDDILMDTHKTRNWPLSRQTYLLDFVDPMDPLTDDINRETNVNITYELSKEDAANPNISNSVDLENLENGLFVWDNAGNALQQPLPIDVVATMYVYGVGVYTKVITVTVNPFNGF